MKPTRLYIHGLVVAIIIGWAAIVNAEPLQGNSQPSGSYSLSEWGSIASIVGLVFSLFSLGVSIYTALNVRKIRNKYMFRLTAPDLVKGLSKHASTLVGYADNSEKHHLHIKEELTKSDVKLMTLESRLKGQSKKSVKQARGSIKKYNPRDNDGIFTIYTEIMRVVEEVKAELTDLNLE